jgi:hypothetical protein
LRFTVRRPPTGEVSPRSHRPPGGDVACSVDIGIAPSSVAGFTLEDRFALAVSWCDMPTCRTSLRRVRSGDLLDPTKRFVLQSSDELAPATCADCAVEPAFLGYLHPHPTKAAVQPLHVALFHSGPPKTFVHISFSPCWTAVRAVEEVLHGLCEIAQRLLLNRLASGSKPHVLGASLRQLRTRPQIAGSLAAGLPMPLLLHRQIPHIPRIPAVRRQSLLLLSSGQQSERRHMRTVSTDTDIPGVSKSRPSASASGPG